MACAALSSNFVWIAAVSLVLRGSPLAAIVAIPGMLIFLPLSSLFQHLPLPKAWADTVAFAAPNAIASALLTYFIVCAVKYSRAISRKPVNSR